MIHFIRIAKGAKAKPQDLAGEALVPFARIIGALYFLENLLGILDPFYKDSKGGQS